jgi:hypothetical protein
MISSRARFASLLLLSLFAAACSGGGDDDDNDPIYVDGDGMPELTGSPTWELSTVPAGDTLDVYVPVDTDTAYARVGVYDVATDTLLVANWAETAAPGATQTGFVTIPLATAAGAYYMDVDLCSSDACFQPYMRNYYRQEDGGGSTYFERHMDYPAGGSLTEIADWHESNVPIVEIQVTN